MYRYGPTLLKAKFFMIFHVFRSTICILVKCSYQDFQEHIREEITEITSDGEKNCRAIEARNSLGPKEPLKITYSKHLVLGKASYNVTLNT